MEGAKNWNCKTLIKVIGKTTGQITEMESFIKICLFDALIGNSDRHGRNLGVINQKKKYALAPLYDNSSNIGIETKALLGAKLEPKGFIATSTTEEPSMSDYVIEFKKLEYEDVCEQFLQLIDKNKLEIKSLIENSFLSPNRKQALRNLMNRRYKELRDNV